MLTDVIYRNATKRAIKIAKENGAVISLNPNLREPLWESPGEAEIVRLIKTGK